MQNAVQVLIFFIVSVEIWFALSNELCETLIHFQLLVHFLLVSFRSRAEFYVSSILNGMHSKMCTNIATSLNKILHKQNLKWLKIMRYVCSFLKKSIAALCHEPPYISAINLDETYLA